MNPQIDHVITEICCCPIGPTFPLAADLFRQILLTHYLNLGAATVLNLKHAAFSFVVSRINVHRFVAVSFFYPCILCVRVVY